MPARKITLVRGQHSEKAVIAAGTAIGGSGGDAIEITIDSTKMTKGEALGMIDEMRQRIHRSKWPLAD